MKCAASARMRDAILRLGLGFHQVFALTLGMAATSCGAQTPVCGTGRGDPNADPVDHVGASRAQRNTDSNAHPDNGGCSGCGSVTIATGRLFLDRS